MTVTLPLWFFILLLVIAGAVSAAMSEAPRRLRRWRARRAAPDTTTIINGPARLNTFDLQTTRRTFPWMANTVMLVTYATRGYDAYGDDVDDVLAFQRIASEIVGRARGNRPPHLPWTIDDTRALIDATLRWASEERMLTQDAQA